MNQINSRHNSRGTQDIGQIIDEHIDREAEKRTTQVNREEFARKSVAVSDYLEKALWQGERELDEDAQLALAKSISLITDIELTDIHWLRRNPQLLDAVYESIKAILKDPPQIKYARCIQHDVYCRLHPWPGKGLYESFRRSIKSSPSAVVVFGLFAAFIFIISLPFLSTDLMLDAAAVRSTLNVDPKTLLLIAAVGALGSVASIMMRIRRDFAAYTRRGGDPWPFFFFALFKPMVGSIFALFAFATINASLVPISPRSGAEGWFFVAIAFLAGFSERFAGDMVYITETSLDQSSPSPPNGGVRGADTTLAKGKEQKDKAPNVIHKKNGKKSAEEAESFREN